ncbi:hypothetical protein AVEN_79649-1 [Araneus ventricosus]|uniref:THAP-type domain-containing protein n=1 Tax=Araneus ventricosus TaxID=182803 RepID=A0A4Y2K2W8_ARAVE|nr:hypothetical protein AVEN_79649-1 [Araneus ventricosus]
MPTCCAVGCSNNAKSDFKLYRLPVGNRNAEKRKQWLHRIGRDNWIPNENSRLCEAVMDSGKVLASVPGSKLDFTEGRRVCGVSMPATQRDLQMAEEVSLAAKSPIMEHLACPKTQLQDFAMDC